MKTILFAMIGLVLPAPAVEKAVLRLPLECSLQPTTRDVVVPRFETPLEYIEVDACIASCEGGSLALEHFFVADGFTSTDSTIELRRLIFRVDDPAVLALFLGTGATALRVDRGPGCSGARVYLRFVFENAD